MYNHWLQVEIATCEAWNELGIIPKEDLNNTTKGNPNFWEGLPIQLEKIYTNTDPKTVPKKTIKELRL